MIVPLSEIIATLESGVSVNSTDAQAVGNQRGVLKVSCVADGRFYSNENKLILPSEIDRVSVSVKRGDLLVTRANTFDLIASCGIADDDYPNLFLSDKLWRVVLKFPHRDYLPWLCHVLCSPGVRDELKKRATGTSGSMKNIPQSSFLNIPVYRPSREDQFAIAKFLDVWDRGIRQLSDLIAAKLRFKQGLMQQLLTGKRRFPEYRDSSFVEHHVGDVLTETFRPVEWNDNELYRLASIRRHSGGLFWREALLGKRIKVKKLHSLAKGDFLISHIQAAYGAMGLVPADFADGKVSDMYTILTPKVEGTIDMRYIEYLSQMRRMRHQAYLACNGFFAERLRLNFDPAEFMKQRILLPESVNEQSRIADLLDTLVGEVRILERELGALKQQKKGLMQKLLTGQIRVAVDKHASVR